MRLNLPIGAIVRTAGEQTEEAAVTALRGQGMDTIVLGGRGEPFAPLLLQAVTAASEMDYQWTLMVDADVVLVKNVGLVLRKIIQEADEKDFVLQPLVFDKAFCTYRSAGIHLYRTQILQENDDLLELRPNSMRPETSFKRKITARTGLKPKLTEDFIGAHEFLQFPKHTYQKAFLKGQKMERWARYLIKLWSEMAHLDNDFKIMRSGFLRGFLSEKLGTYSLRRKGQYWPRSIPAQILRKFPERCALDVTMSDANQIVEDFELSPIAQKMIESKNQVFQPF